MIEMHQSTTRLSAASATAGIEPGASAGPSGGTGRVINGCSIEDLWAGQQATPCGCAGSGHFAELHCTALHCTRSISGLLKCALL